MSAPGKLYGPGYAILPDVVLYSGVSPNAKLLWAVLQRHAGPEGRCYPGLKRLGQLLGVSEQTVRRAKQELLEAKLITCHERYDEAGRRTSDDVILVGAPTKSDRGDPIKFGRVISIEKEPERTNAREAPQNPTPLAFDPDYWIDDKGRTWVRPA